MECRCTQYDPTNIFSPQPFGTILEAEIIYNERGSKVRTSLSSNLSLLACFSSPFSYRLLISIPSSSFRSKPEASILLFFYLHSLPYSSSPNPYLLFSNSKVSTASTLLLLLCVLKLPLLPLLIFFS